MKKVEYEELNTLYQQLINKAIAVRENASANYSKFKVGAALLDENGNIHCGINVETADYTLTTHAEMLAVDNMIMSGAREIKAIAIALSSNDEYAVPCGLCRQKMSEFSQPECDIICVNLNSEYKIKTIYITNLEELLPFPFMKSALQLSYFR